MKRLLLATTACAGWAVAAQAADLPVRAAPPVYAPPAFSWTGFYVGVNAGYGFGRRNGNNDFFVPSTVAFPAGNGAFAPGSGFITTNPAFPNGTPFFVIGNNNGIGGAGAVGAGATAAPFAGGIFAAPGTLLTLNNNNGLFNTNRRKDGFVGGGQVGYNWQLTPGYGVVFGIEADIQFADLNRRGDNFCGFNFGVGCGSITVGPGVVGAPLFNGPVVIPTTVGGPGNAANPPTAAQLLAGGGTPLIPAAANPLATGQLATNLASGVFANSPFNVGTVAILNQPAASSAAAVGPVTFFDPRTFNRNNNNGVDWFGTVRGRLGYGFDRVLIYATGGLAYGGGHRDDNFGNFGGLGFGGGFGGIGFGFGGNCGFNNDCNRIRVGWTAGGGLEYAFTNNLSLKIEGLYVSLDNRNNNNNNLGFLGAASIPYARDAAGVIYSAPAGAFSNNGFFGFDRRNRDDFAVVRVGLNYKFDWGYAAPPPPVVARY